MLLLPEGDRRTVPSELAEGWSLRVARSGDEAARKWYRLQATQHALRLGLERVRRWRQGGGAGAKRLRGGAICVWRPVVRAGRHFPV